MMNQNPPGFSTHTLTLRQGIEIAYTDEGSGPVSLLLVHGLGTSRLSWNKLVGELRHEFRVIAPDLPGYGDSTVGSFPFGMHFFADILEELIGCLRLGKVIMVGHSMGGQISLVQALSRPNFLDRLVLLAPAGFETFTRVESIWLSNLYRPSFLEAVPFSRVEKNVRLNFFNFPEDAWLIVEQRRVIHENPELHKAYCKMLSMCVQSMLRTPVLEVLPGIRIPVLTVFGLEDALIPNTALHPRLTVRDIALAGHSQLPAGSLALLPECGHMLQWECSVAVAAQIRQFVLG